MTTEMMVLRVDKDLKEKLSKQAKENYRSLSKEVEFILKDAIYTKNNKSGDSE